jgi:glycosyltransferase involved in cell wall biosynthesis
VSPLPRPRTDIAVVVPLYNHERFVAATLRSLLDQSAAPAEIVLIDDGSTDSGLSLAREILRDVPDCRVLTQENAGAHVAINRAVAMTDAPFAAVLNSDDVFVREKLQWCQEMLAAEPEAHLVAGRVALIDGRGEAITRGPHADWHTRAEKFVQRTGLGQLALLHENFVATTSNIVFSRALWQRVGGFAALRYCHDLDFLMRAYDGGRVVLDRARTHVRYRVHGGNTIAEDPHRVRAELAAVIAATLCQSGARLLPDGDAGFAAFTEFLRAKGMSDLVLYLAAIFPRFESRDAFFAWATADENFARFVRYLRGPA